jgi:TatD family-associated radical SAM protein
MSTVSYRIGDNLYLNITDRCTLACRFCPKHNGSHHVHDHDLALDHRPTVEEVIDGIGCPADYREVVFCGFGEPTLRLKPLLAIARHVQARGGRVRVNTDGLANLVHKRDVLPELGSCVDALSISLNADTEALYRRHCQPALPGSFQAVLDFISRAPRHVPEVYASAIDGLPGVDIAACRDLVEQRGARFRRRMLDVVG